jgi:tight adherence protein B
MVVLIDASGSMAGTAIAAAKEAAINFVDALPAGSDVSILAFGDGVDVVAEPGVSRDVMVAAVMEIEAAGNTALYDAVLTAASLVSRTTRTRQFVVVLSDGGDTISTATLAEAAAPAPYRWVSPSNWAEQDPEALAAMAEATGGSVVAASDASGLSPIYAEIARAVVSQYAVVFEAATGGQSTVEVVVATAGSEVRLSADLVLPAMPGTASGVVVTLPESGSRTITPPVEYVYPGPSRLQEDWALRTGVVLVGITLVILFGYALQPAEGRPGRSILASSLDPTSKGRRRWWQRRSAIAVPGLTNPNVGSARRRGVDAALDAAGIDISSGEYLTLVTFATLGGLALGIVVDSPLLGLMLMIAAIMIPRAVVSRAAGKRRAASDDLTTALLWPIECATTTSPGCDAIGINKRQEGNLPGPGLGGSTIGPHQIRRQCRPQCRGSHLGSHPDRPAVRHRRRHLDRESRLSRGFVRHDGRQGPCGCRSRAPLDRHRLDPPHRQDRLLGERWISR